MTEKVLEVLVLAPMVIFLWFVVAWMVFLVIADAVRTWKRRGR